MDAVLRVRHLSDRACSEGGVLLAVSIDIANAFNTIPWSTIVESLRFHRVPPSLRTLIEDYLSGRNVVFPERRGWGRKAVSCGVPQGSVLGPLLWDIGFDWVLRGASLRGVDVVCYADDTLVTARGADYRAAAILATAAVSTVVSRIRRLGLEVALRKSEAVCFHPVRRGPPPGANLIVGGVSIAVQPKLKYLGLVLDSRWRFDHHFGELVPKLLGMAGALARLLPNVGGCSAGVRRLYLGVVRSMALYGAPVWSPALSARNAALLLRAQRVLAVRVIRGYRTISREVACALAGSLPWDLEAEVAAAVYRRRTQSLSRGRTPGPSAVGRWRRAARHLAYAKWRERLLEELGQTSVTRRRTLEALVPVLEAWSDRRHGVLSFHLTQVLSGHGCFGRYLWKVCRREPHPGCHQCGHPDDDAQHALEACPRWERSRRDLIAVLGRDLSLRAVVARMLEDRNSWEAMTRFCDLVMAFREAEEREREWDPSSASQRRRRSGRHGREAPVHLP
ncbi:retrovirus-related Pol polyprotein from type-1 retrotransposable element R1 [Bombyx mori]|uniref:retrovirus-related Pol polyprotein from type-1 retrotransposable element R1 n=1 Tax=Bombyx mori TaxID=7091 RepID=UPI002ED4EBF1